MRVPWTWMAVVASWLVLAAAALIGTMQAAGGGNIGAIWLLPVVGSGVLLLSLWWHGVRGTVYAAALACFVIGSVWQAHAGFRVAYLEGDVARETLIYNTTSPDVAALAADLETLSLSLYGDRSLGIMVEACNSLDWPLRWHLREMSEVRYVGALPNATDTLPPVVIGSLAVWSGGTCDAPDVIPGYTSQPIVLRWHEPEAVIYRRFAIAPELERGQSAWTGKDQETGFPAVIGSIVDAFRSGVTDEGQRRLIDILLYHQLPAGLNPFYVNVYIRNDILPAWTQVRY